jgi:hypothetical protein
MAKGRCLELEGAGRRPVGRWAAWWLRADPWPLLVLALVLSSGYFWLYRSPTVAMVGLAYHDDFCLGSFLFGLVAAVRCAQLLVRQSCEVRFVVLSLDEFRSRRWFFPWLIAITTGTFLMVRAELPMHLSFLLSRPGLDANANEALADPGNAQRLAGRRAGLYQVAGVEVIGETVVLYLGKDKGSYGFARVPGTKADRVSNDSGWVHHADHEGSPKTEGFRDPRGDRIGGDWFVMYSGYWRWKVGWS